MMDRLIFTHGLAGLEPRTPATADQLINKSFSQFERYFYPPTDEGDNVCLIGKAYFINKLRQR
jgi:hypothetical protein